MRAPKASCYHRVLLTQPCAFCRLLSEVEPRTANGGRYQYRYGSKGKRLAGRTLSRAKADTL